MKEEFFNFNFIEKLFSSLKNSFNDLIFLNQSLTEINEIIFLTLKKQLESLNCIKKK